MKIRGKTSKHSKVREFKEEERERQTPKRLTDTGMLYVSYVRLKCPLRQSILLSPNNSTVRGMVKGEYWDQA